MTQGRTRLPLALDDWDRVWGDQLIRAIDQNFDAPISSADTTFLQSGTSAVTRTVQSKERDVVSVKDFGAVGDGVVDDTAAIQAAINYCATVTRGEVFIPQGFYRVSSLSITSGSISIRGAGKSVAVLQPTSATANFITVSGSAFDFTLRDLRIRSTVTSPTAGAAIYCTDGVGATYLSNLRIEKCFRGVETYNPASTFVSGFLRIADTDIAECSNSGIYINGISQFFSSNVTIYGAGTNGLIVYAGGAFHIANTTATGVDVGFNFYPGSGQVIYDVFATNCEADTCGVNGWSFNGSVGTISTIKIGQSRAGYCTNFGFITAGNGIQDISVTGFTAQKNGDTGILISGGNRIELSSCAVSNNSSLGSGKYGVKISGGQDITVIGGSSGVFKTESSTQDYSIVVDAAFSGTLLINGFNARAGWTLGSIINYSTSNNIQIINCPGFNPLGVYYPTVGASPWTYQAGTSGEFVVLNGGLVTGITIAGVAVSIPATTGYLGFSLAPRQTLVMTYSSAPNIAVSRN